MGEIVDTYVVYNIFDTPERKGDPWRMMVSEDGFESRLEKYIFHRLRDGSYLFEAQEGWFAGSHYDGNGNTFPLPQEWFESWNVFLNAFSAAYEAKNFSYTRDELASMPELRSFLRL